MLRITLRLFSFGKKILKKFLLKIGTISRFIQEHNRFTICNIKCIVFLYYNKTSMKHGQLWCMKKFPQSYRGVRFIEVNLNQNGPLGHLKISVLQRCPSYLVSALQRFYCIIIFSTLALILHFIEKFKNLKKSIYSLHRLKLFQNNLRLKFPFMWHSNCTVPIPSPGQPPGHRFFWPARPSLITFATPARGVPGPLVIIFTKSKIL